MGMGMANRDWQKSSLPSVFNGKTSCSPGTQHLKLENRKNFSVENVVKSWHRLSRAVLEAPSLEGFKRRVGVGLEDVA